MISRKASCTCGKLTLSAQGEPVRISVCHCLDCQRRTGSTYGVQARYPIERVAVAGNSSKYRRLGDSGGTIQFHFCPTCGATVYWFLDKAPGVVVVAVGAFADPHFPPPKISVYDRRKHAWICLPGNIEHMD